MRPPSRDVPATRPTPTAVAVRITDETRSARRRAPNAKRKTGRGIRPRVLATQLRCVLAWLGYTHGNWSIALVKDAAMRRLHERVMQDPTTTDVLTFDLRDAVRPRARKSGKHKELDLDTVICLDQAARQAEALGHPVHDEALLYAVHSLLHVSGYDDTSPTKARRMHRREDELLVQLGVGSVYARQGEKGPGTGKVRAARRATQRGRK